MEILTYPNEILTTPCKRITEFNKELNNTIIEMFNLLYKLPNAVGIAANQIGLNIQLAVIDHSHLQGERNPLILINPFIIRKNNPVISKEGCLSLPGQFYDVIRFNNILISNQDLKGKNKTLPFSGFQACVVLHEMAHLQGLLINHYGQFTF